MEKSSDPIPDIAVTQKPAKRERSFRFWMMAMGLVFCALMGAVYWAVTTVVLPLAQAVEAAEQSQAAASNTTVAVQPRVDLDQYKFAPNAPTGDQLRPALEKW
ncbi:MAG TPA: hypothetical protein VK956_00005, partial [Verrucomicrobium sp.]|nr:hypothetical protein [Verrucomicrobium sp.]